jgi:uncharacterized protein YegP (UPF0339 family)
MAGWYELSLIDAGRYSFNLMDGSGNVLLYSSFYSNKAEAEAAIAAAQQSSPQAERYEKGTYYEGRLIFWLNDASGNNLGQSGVFETEEARDAGIAAIIVNGPTKDVRGKS